MKRILFLGICAGLGMSIGCGDDASSGPDGGVADGGLYSGLDKLSDGLGAVGSGIEDLKKRLDDLENPPAPPGVGSCSEGGELCIPDGLDITKTDLVSLVEAVCENAFDCCEDNEIFLNFGPGITDLDSCVAGFKSFVERGIPPGYVAQAVINNVVLIAQALNTPGRQGQPSISFNKDGIDECAAQIADTKCVPFVKAADFCDPFKAAPANACALTKVVNGLLENGEPCNLGLTGAGVPQCADGFTCRSDGNAINPNGICAREPVEDDPCAADSDCVSVGGMMYCDNTIGLCAKPGGKGDDCLYADPSLVFSTKVSVRCKTPFVCDPDTEKCVEPCSIGYSCFDNTSCPKNKVCDLTTYGGTGFCRDAFSNGDVCSADAECKSGYCDAFGTGKCAPALKEFGEDCSPSLAFDATCVSNYCGPDGKCTKDCFVDDDCPDTHFCTFGGECEPRRENTQSCNPPNDRNCVEGSWCNGSADCADLVVDTGSCASGDDRECENGICDTNTCTAPLALNADCGVGGSRACGHDAYCNFNIDGSPQNQCKAFRKEGQSCGPGIQCEADLECAGTDVKECYVPNEHPVGGFCGANGDCTTGICVDAECMNPAAKDDDCDSAGIAAPPCDANTYCKTADGTTTEGTCKSRRTAGQSCLPRYAGGDCLNGVSCDEKHGGFYCGLGAVEPGTLTCDGT